MIKKFILINSLLFVLVLGIHLSKSAFNGVLMSLPEQARYEYVNFILRGDKLLHLKVVTLELLLERKYDADNQILFTLCDRSSKTIGEPIPQLAVKVIHQNYNDKLLELLDFYKYDELSSQIIKRQIEKLQLK